MEDLVKASKTRFAHIVMISLAFALLAACQPAPTPSPVPAAAPTPSPVPAPADKDVVTVTAEITTAGICPPVNIWQYQGVTWINKGNETLHVRHQPDKGDPEFDKFIPTGEKFTHFFRVPGTFKYTCSANGKTGTANVTVNSQ